MPIRVKQPERLNAGPTVVPVTLDETAPLLRATDGSEFGSLLERQARILHTLEEVEGVNLQFYCQPKCGKALGGGKNRKGTVQEPQHPLCAIIYGPFRLFDCVGAFVSQCELYLQDPVHCNRNVPYRNPHLLSGLDEEPPMTISFNETRVPVDVEEMSSRPDLCTLLRSEDPLPETEAPPALCTMLYRYSRHNAVPMHFTYPGVIAKVYAVTRSRHLPLCYKKNKDGRLTVPKIMSGGRKQIRVVFPRKLLWFSGSV